MESRKSNYTEANKEQLQKEFINSFQSNTDVLYYNNLVKLEDLKSGKCVSKPP